MRETKKESRATNPFSHVAPRRFFAVIPAKAGIQTADAGVVWERGRPAGRAALARGDTLILAFSHEGLTGVGLLPWERGRPARRAALARGAPSS